jgi:hypothetical protein
MTKPTFDQLPFNVRPDLTPYLVHLTKHTKREDNHSAYDNLVNILETGRIWGSSKKGFVKGSKPAACFMDVPFASLKYVLNKRDADPQKPRYQPYGVAVTKPTAYKRGCRPVLYLSDRELGELNIPPEQHWRVVRFETEAGRWISFVHEREWRCSGNFKLPRTIHAAFVRTTKEALALTSLLHAEPNRFKCVPRSVIPLTVLCQGLEIGKGTLER